ncbi:hypothetical protein [Thalassobaculum salexigens]|uniref:hypothetical protein n=1 Tax=Thalassobaculum salexigens TaxID=455360 RepID=UPI00248F3C3F|nr:hypothetical protein [Thalassobaculum salexigens]
MTKSYEIKINLNNEKVKRGENSKSISVDFQCDRLPDFCVLSGYNGAGKTQFFEALVSGYLSVEGVDSIDINLFNYTNFLQQAKNELKLSFKGDETWQGISKITSELIKEFEPRSIFGRNHWRDVFIEEEQKWEEENYDSAEYYRRNYISEYDPDYKRIFPFKHFRKELNNKIRAINPMLLELTKKITINHEKDFFLLDSSEFIAAVDGVSLEVDLFSNSFSTVCSQYSEKLTDNLIRGFLSSQGGDISGLSDEEFKKLHGPPPWETFQEYLDHAGMPYRVSEPNPIYERVANIAPLGRSSIVPFKPNLYAPSGISFSPIFKLLASISILNVVLYKLKSWPYLTKIYLPT